MDSGACCPGLIEAIEIDHVRRPGSLGIPGLAALASLKQSREPRTQPTVQRIPGLAALASLKLKNLCCCVVDATRIPGLAALASLKRLIVVAVQLCLPGEDSGACCPGLIEARFFPSS